MAHPVRFDKDDPLLRRVRALAAALPGAAEKVSHGRPAFYTTKVFAYYGSAVKVGDVWVQHPQCITVLLPEDERAALLAEERCFVPGYLGPTGWIGVDLADPAVQDGPDWAEVAELLQSSYRRTAGRRWVAELEAQHR